ncbi:ATP-binding protein [Sulfitobacter sp. MF3-043]|uniref:ATP-binding protein n=1 Tax=Sulfitobacter sediminivivens TaxID=3252902 RepID=UPI0036DF117E
MKVVFSRLLSLRFSGYTYALVFVLLVSLFLIAAEFDNLLRANFIKDVRLDHTLELIEAREEIEEKVFDHFLVLQKLVTLIEENYDLDQKQFGSLVESLNYEGDDIINFAAAPDLVVRFVYPYDENAAVVGLDYTENDLQRAGVMRAVEDGTATIDGPIELVQGGRALIIRQPIFIDSNTAGGSGKVWGIVSMVVDHGRFLDQTGLTALSQEYKLFLRLDSGEKDQISILFGSPELEQQSPIELEISFPNGNWSMMAIPKPGWPKNTPNHIRNRLIMGVISLLIIGVVLSVAALAAAEKKSRIRLTSAIQAMNDGFAMFDSDGVLIEYNSRYSEIYETVSDQIRRGASFEDIIRLAVDRGPQAAAMGREEEWVQERLEDFDGPDIEFEQELSNSRFILASDHNTIDGGKVCLRTDVTDLKQALKTAESASRAKSDFMNTLSHELRTPLTVILGTVGLIKHIQGQKISEAVFLELAKDPIDRKGASDALTFLIRHVVAMMGKQERSAKHLLALVDDMLDFAKLETGSYSIEANLCDVDQILMSVSEQTQQLAKDKGLDLMFNSEGGQVYCDPLRTTQILLNLVTNALKFVSAGEVEISVRHGNNDVIFAVSDTGPGISSEDQERVFNAFEQVDSSDTRSNGGVGLGLAISRKLATAQNGTLRLESEFGVGSKFTLRLPARSTEKAGKGSVRGNLLEPIS